MMDEREARMCTITPPSSINLECGKYQELFHGILLAPQNTVMDMNNVM